MQQIVENGARCYGIIRTVVGTCKLQGIDPIDLVHWAYSSGCFDVPSLTGADPRLPPEPPTPQATLTSPEHRSNVSPAHGDSQLAVFVTPPPVRDPSTSGLQKRNLYKGQLLQDG